MVLQYTMSLTTCTGTIMTCTVVYIHSIVLDAPWELKAAYAFRVYDFNGDAYLCQDDLAETLIYITGNLPLYHMLRSIESPGANYK